MRQTQEDAYSLIISENLQYDRNKEQWQYLLESYMGGLEYRKGHYLTRYDLESESEYLSRLVATPLDNHCKSVISVYTSFLFRNEPYREMNSIESDPAFEDFMKDADYDGRNFNSFMKEVSIWASVFGHCYVIMSKPKVQAANRAQELEQGVRPYCSILTPLVVLDWSWSRSATGRYTLDYIKYIEDVNDTITVIKEWSNEAIKTTTVNTDEKEILEEIVEDNELGMVPVVVAYNQRSPIRGIGVSDINDIADHQRKIFNELSEVEQSIRLNGHPALVKTPTVEAVGGAGAIISMPEDLDPGLKPYMLTTSTDTDSIYRSIEASVGAIDKMANTGAVRANETVTMSGVAMEVEFSLLNAKLSEKADNLEVTEEQLWRLYALYQDRQYDATIEYPDSFNIRDTDKEFAHLEKAKTIASDPRLVKAIDSQLMELLDIDEDDLEEAFTPHVMINPQTNERVIAATYEQHLELAAQGYMHEGE